MQEEGQNFGMNENAKDKKTLRSKMKQLRKERAYQTEDGVKNFFSLSEVKRAETFFVYKSFASEFDTKKLIDTLLKQGKKVYLPRVERQDMVAVLYQDKDTMSKSNYGIEEPLGKAYSGKIDMAVIPLLAVTKDGARLGYGGGYYDKFLKNRDCLKIAYCYDFQIVDDVPKEEHDVLVDLIVTDKQVFYVKG